MQFITTRMQRTAVLAATIATVIAGAWLATAPGATAPSQDLIAHVNSK